LALAALALSESLALALPLALTSAALTDDERGNQQHNHDNN